MALADPPPLSCTHYTHTSSIHSSRNPSWTEIPLLGTNANEVERVIHHAERSAGLTSRHYQKIDALANLENTEHLGMLQEKTPDTRDSIIPFPQISLDHLNGPHPAYSENPTSGHKKPFQKWMRSLHRRATHRPAIRDTNENNLSWKHLTPDGTDRTDRTDRTGLHRRFRNRDSTSGSSFRFVSAVQSASISLASASAVTQSRRNATLSYWPSETDHSSQASMCEPVLSEDSVAMGRPMPVDAAVTRRSLQRRQILEELISTEESYIGDVRFLMNVYVTILVSLPTLPMRLRSSINQNLTEIVELHEEILGDLHRIVPHSEYSQIDLSFPLDKPKAHEIGHRRWWSTDAIAKYKVGDSWLQNIPGMVADPQVAAEVAKLFSKKMNRFFIYKEYGAKYEMMIKDVASAHHTMPQWKTYQKGLETLASTLVSARINNERPKKSLTIGDLLVKPIQRVCKYPLLFAELLKCTPVCDCPNSHMEVETALMRLREATAEINRATNDGHMKATLEKTWLLQDRLVFAERRLDAASKNHIRSFGYIQLCGALHICWQANDSVRGQYMVCLLYRSVLCLASVGKVDPIYTIRASIDLNMVKIEDVDNGQGLQCNTAPFSWKLVFENDHQLYELIMTACSPKEELEWKSRLSRSTNQERAAAAVNVYHTLSMNMKSLGTVFGRPGTMARKNPIHRATTVGPKSPLCQVILKNTSVTSNHVQAARSISRSQSLLTTNARIPVLAPPLSERSRLETLLMDVWSRDVLPIPGMALRSRGEQMVRNSASIMIRKLSVSGIAVSFSKKHNNGTQRCPGVERLEICEGAIQRSSKSSDSIPDCGTSTYSGIRRLSKRARTQVAITKHGDVEHDKELEVGGIEEPNTVQVCDLATINLSPKATEEKETSLSHASAIKTPRQSSSLSSDKSLSFYDPKEIAGPLIIDESKDHGRRWMRVGGSRQEGKSQGLRNLFR